MKTFFLLIERFKTKITNRKKTDSCNVKFIILFFFHVVQSMSAAPSSLVDVLSRQFHEATRRCAELEILLSESREWAGKLEQRLREANGFIDNSGLQTRSTETSVVNTYNTFDEMDEIENMLQRFQSRTPSTSTSSPFTTPEPVRRSITPASISRVSWSRRRLLYTKEDDLKIVRFILESQHSPNGQILWKKAADENLIPGRTWQSLEGRYKKNLKYRFEALVVEAAE
jgi:hypothetical protein